MAESDKFTEMMDKMASMGDDERKKAMEDGRKLCVCGGCPSYNDCAKGKDELLFCAAGKSKDCIKQEMGCLCPGCPLTSMMGLKHAYFCTKGTEKEQRGM